MQSPIIWEVKNYDYNTAGQISRRLSISPLCAGLLVQRGVKTPEEARYFLHADLKDLQDPFNLTGIEPAFNYHISRFKIQFQNRIIRIC